MMKQISFTLAAIVSVFLLSCGSKSGKTDNSEAKTTSTMPSDTTVKTPANSMGVQNLLDAYLVLKNALTTDKPDEAATAAQQMLDAMSNFDESGLTLEQKKIYEGVKEDIREHAEHISKSSADIEHEREHFDMLSRDMIDLINVTGSSKTLYNDFCPMYNKKKGASWLSETKEIRNPYYGKQMQTCGEVKEEIKPK